VQEKKLGNNFLPTNQCSGPHMRSAAADFRVMQKNMVSSNEMEIDRAGQLDINICMPRKARIDAPGAFYHQEVFGGCQQQVERRYHLAAKGRDFDWLVGYVARLFGLSPMLITRPGRYPNTVEARSVLCYWAVREFGVTTVAPVQETRCFTTDGELIGETGRKDCRRQGSRVDRVILINASIPVP
jgi:hypothetical protein